MASDNDCFKTPVLLAHRQVFAGLVKFAGTVNPFSPMNA
jgi:hypothetical protein